VIKKSLHISTKIILLTSIFIALLGISGFVWVITGPRSLSVLTPFVEEEFNSRSGGYFIDIDKSYIKWNGFHGAFSIYATDVRLLNETKDVLASFPNASFDLSLIRILKGEFLSSDMRLEEPSFHIDLSDDPLYTEVEKADAKTKIFKDIHSQISSIGNKLPVKSILIEDGNLFINNGQSDIAWKIKEGYARIDDGKKNRLTSELKINFGQEESYFKIGVVPENKDSLNFHITFKSLPSFILKDLFPDIASIRNFDVHTNGEFDFLWNDSNTIPKLNYTITSAKGTIELPSAFKEKINLNSFSSRGGFYKNFSSITIDSLKADIGGPIINISGQVSNKAQLPDFSPDIEISFDVENIDINKIDNFWPLKIGKRSREWVTQRVSEGKASAHGKLKLTPKTLDNLSIWKNSVENEEIPLQPPLTDDAIDATVSVEGATIDYFRKYPKAANVTAEINFTGQRMQALISSGEMLSSNLTKSSVTISNLWISPLDIEVEAQLEGPVEDALEFVKANKDRLPDSDTMRSVYNTTGSASTHAVIKMLVSDTVLYDDTEFDISSNINDMTIPSIINNKDLTNGSINLSVTKQKIHAKGTAKINGKPLDIEYTQNLEDESQFDKIYNVKGEVSPTYISELGLGDIPNLSGLFSADISIKEQDGTYNIDGSADLTKASFNINEFSFNKPKGEEAKLDFSATQEAGGTINIKNFTAQGANINAKGSARLKDSTLEKIQLEDSTIGNNEITLDYQSSPSHLKITAKGNKLDLSESKFGEIFENDKTSKKRSIDALIEIANVSMKNNKNIKDLSVNITCTAEHCSSVNAYGKLSDDNFMVMSMKPLGDRSSLLVESDNAGLLISALGISPNIRDGHLNIESTFADKGNKIIAKGVMRIRDFTAVKTPLLGKLLTLASFKGIGDLLNNEGISFKKFEAPFTMSDDKIWINDAKSSGSSVGITATGNINLAKGELDLTGAVVPAYEVNKFLGKIPLVGDLIVGKKNEGIIATKYKIQGPYEEAKVTVNPLSILTPGFLRNIFDFIP